MNKLSSCKTYNDLKKGIVDLDKMLGPDVSKYLIPVSFYESYFNILSVKKYPLVGPTIRAAKAGRIRLMNHSDPKDLSNKAYILPDMFSCFTTPIRKPGDKCVALVNAFKKTGYIRNADKEAIGLKVNEVALYSYLQTGYLGILLAEKDEEISRNVKLHTLLAEFYSSLVGKVIDKIYPISGEPGAYTRLLFLLSLFYLQFMCGFDELTALKIAPKIKTVDMAEVSQNSRVLNSNSFKMNSFDDFISLFMVEFPYIKSGTVTLRAIVGDMIKLYGSGAMFALEHFQSFLNLIECVGLRSNMYRDDIISKTIPSTVIKNVDKTLLLISGEV